MQHTVYTHLHRGQSISIFYNINFRVFLHVVCTVSNYKWCIPPIHCNLFIIFEVKFFRYLFTLSVLNPYIYQVIFMFTFFIRFVCCNFFCQKIFRYFFVFFYTLTNTIIIIFNISTVDKFIQKLFERFLCFLFKYI